MPRCVSCVKPFPGPSKKPAAQSPQSRDKLPAGVVAKLAGAGRPL